MIEKSSLVNFGCYVNPLCPINWRHPLVKGGAYGLWLPTSNSGWSGGSTLRDLNRGDGRAPRDATFTGGVSWKTDFQGNRCLQFNGTNAYAQSTCPNLANGYTVMFWFRPERSVNFELLLDSNAGASQNSDLRIYTNASGEIHADTNGTDLLVAGVALNAWNFAALTRKGSSNTLYFKTSTSTSSTAIGSTTTNLRFGASSDSTNFFQGRLAGVALLPYVLTAGEIRQYCQISRQNFQGILNRITIGATNLILSGVATPGVLSTSNFSRALGRSIYEYKIDDSYWLFPQPSGTISAGWEPVYPVKMDDRIIPVPI